MALCILDLPQLQNLFFDLQRLVVGKLDDVGHWLEQGLIYMDLGIGVDGAVTDVQKLDNLRLRKLFNNAFS